MLGTQAPETAMRSENTSSMVAELDPALTSSSPSPRYASLIACRSSAGTGHTDIVLARGRLKTSSPLIPSMLQTQDEGATSPFFSQLETLARV